MNPSTVDIAANIEQVRQRIEAACQRAGRSSDEVTLVAVSKQKSVADVLQAIKAGITNFGENRVEEAVWKISETERYAPAAHHWHMIGHIQSRKALDVVRLNFALIHSLHDLKLATRYNRFAEEQGFIQPVLLEINVSGEETKSGWNMAHWEQQPERRAELWHDIEAMLQLPALRIEGLMTMAPWVDNPEQIRPVFQALARLREALQNEFYQLTWQHLSMGMTDDFEIAIEEGATLVRIGRAIFGERAA